MLELLFTSKNRVKILGLFLFSNNSFSLREVERKLKISVSAIKREVDNLVKLSILKKQDNKFKLNENCNFTYDLRNVFLKTDFFL